MQQQMSLLNCVIKKMTWFFLKKQFIIDSDHIKFKWYTSIIIIFMYAAVIWFCVLFLMMTSCSAALMTVNNVCILRSVDINLSWFEENKYLTNKISIFLNSIWFVSWIKSTFLDSILMNFKLSRNKEKMKIKKWK